MRSSHYRKSGGGRKPGGGVERARMMEGSDGKAWCLTSPEPSCRAQGPQEEVGFYSEYNGDGMGVGREVLRFALRLSLLSTVSTA